MKKMLYLPLLVPGGACEQYDLEAAFRKVYDVRVIDHINGKEPNIELVKTIEEWQPDYVHIQASGRLDLNTVAGLKIVYPTTIFTQWCGDARPDPLPLIVEWGRACDATLLAVGRGQKELYEKATFKPVYWWQHAVADWQFREMNPDANRSVVMVANSYGNGLPGWAERLDLAQRLTDSPIPFIAYGDGYPTTVHSGGRIGWKKQTDIYNQHLISIGPNVCNDIALYFSDRPLIAMAACSCHFMRYVPNLEALFEDGVDCVFYRTNEEAIEKLAYFVKRPSECLEIAASGQRKVREFHTFDYRVKEYGDIVDQIKSCQPQHV